MEYFKIVINNNIIGITTSLQFIYYDSIADSLLRTDKLHGEYLTYKGDLYRDIWMSATTINIPYISATILPITQDEYLILLEAFKTQNEIIDTDTIPDNIVIDDETEEYQDNTSIDFIRLSKIQEMSYQCNKTIEHGFDIETEDGTHHYSYALEDLLNLMNLSSMIALGANELFYHADGELCRFYTPAEINEIINAGNAWKTYHTTYFNALKSYINSLETIEEIGAITYGVDIPDEFKTDVLKILEY